MARIRGEGGETTTRAPLDALVAISSTVNASLDVEAVLADALAIVLKFFDFPSGVLRRLEPLTGELPLAARAGLSPELEQAVSVPLRVGDAPLGLATQRRAITIVKDLQRSPTHAGSPWAHHGYQTLVSVPLQSRGMLLGCLTMVAPDARPFGDADRELLTAAANLIGMAVANAELYAAAQRKIEYLSTLHQCTHDLGPAPDLDRVLSVTTRRMAQLLHLNLAAVALCSSGTDELWGAAGYIAGTENDSEGTGEGVPGTGCRVPSGEEIEGPATVGRGTQHAARGSEARRPWVDGLRAPLASLPLAATVLREKQLLVSCDPVGDGLLPAELVRAVPMQAVLAVPLVAHDEVIGMLVGGRGEKQLLLSTDEMELAMIFANQAAVWITNARLFVREHAARARAETTEERFRGLLESAPDGIVIVNREGRIVLLNTQAERMFRYRREELLDQPVEILMPNRLREAHVMHRTGYAAAPGTRPMGLGLDLLGRRKDGSEFPVEISLSPLQTAEGLLVTSVIRDISERKQAEEERARLLAREQEKSEQLKLSVREAHHRIKNNLQAISDLLYLELTSGESTSSEDALRASIERIQAIATVHDLLSQDEDVRVVDARAVLERLVPMVLRSSGLPPDGVTLRTDVHSIPLSSRRATALALIANELVSNAAKHAFRNAIATGEAGNPPYATRPNELSVALHQESEEVVLQVQDNGPGLPPGFSLDSHSHVGLDVVRTLAERDLDGSFTLTSEDGVLAEVRFSW